MLADIAQKLQAMHSYGYVHRDLKPANVMLLPRDNQWYLIDFGCAAKIGDNAPLSFTMAYAAPEVLAAWKASKETTRASAEADAWSFGVMVFELLTGRPAFDIFFQGRDQVCMYSIRGPFESSDVANTGLENLVSSNKKEGGYVTNVPCAYGLPYRARFLDTHLQPELSLQHMLDSN